MIKWAKKSIHALMCVCALLGVAIFIGCPTETPSNNRENKGDAGSASVFKLVENATKETIVAAETVETSANALLSFTAGLAERETAAKKLYDDADSMYKKAKDTKDAAAEVVKKVKADEKSASASSGSSFITSSVKAAKKSARLIAAEAALTRATKALEKAEKVRDAAEVVYKDVRNNKQDDAQIREVIKLITSIKLEVKQVQVVSKSVEAIKADTTTETILIVGDGFDEKSKGQYEATMEVGDTANFEIKDLGVGAGNLTYKKTKGANNKFNVAVNNTDRTIKFESNVPTADTYTYTISKAKTGSNTKAKNVTVTIIVKAKQEFITLNTSFAQMEAGKTTGITFTDSGEGTGALSATYKKGPGDRKFTVAKTGRTITFTPEASSNAPAVGVYVYTINKAKTGTNTKAVVIPLVIEVVKEIAAKTETIELDKTEATITLGANNIRPVIVTDSGVGLGKLTFAYKKAGSTSDGFLPVVNRRSITFTPKTNPPLTKGTYIYTISKAKTGKNTKAKDVEVTITVKEQPKVLAFAKATTEGTKSNFEAFTKTSATMKQAAAVGTDKLVINDAGHGEGRLSITAVSKAGGSVDLKAFQDIFTVTEAKDKITITPKDKLVNAEVGVYTLTIKKADVAATKTFTLTVKATPKTVKQPNNNQQNTSPAKQASTLVIGTSTKSMTEGVGVPIEFAYSGAGNGAVTAEYKSGGDGDKFDVTYDVPNKKVILTPKGNDAPGAGTYVYTVKKAGTASHNAATDVDVTITVNAKQASTLVIGTSTKSMTEGVGAPIEFAYSGAGNGAVTAEYKSGGDGDKFDVTYDVPNKKVILTPKGSDAPGAGTYVYTVKKAGTASHNAATDVDVTITVNAKQASTLVIGTSTKSMTEGVGAPIEFAYSGAGNGAVTAEYKSGGDGDKFDVTYDVPNKKVILTPKDSDAPGAGTYVYTVKKAGTASHNAATDVDVTITVN